MFEKADQVMWECLNCGHLVVGKKAPVVGRKIVAYVIGLKNTEKEIRKVCMANLPEFSQPAEIVFLDEFPKTKMNKVNYRELESR